MNQPRPSLPSDQFGPYELYERLGMGGMATVHRAKKRGPEGFERAVALKRMLPHLAEDHTFVESFVREAKVASLLQHPNVAQIYDFGRLNGVYYIAMEMVAGHDIRKLLRTANRSNEPIPLGVILSLLTEMCEALDYAHHFVDEEGTPLHIVHRDISPSNLIVAHTGHLKVIDFGIAKAASHQLHTESGAVKGKLGYMSPEAAVGMQVAPVSDLFSMGVVAWELVTASPLFSARTDFETMRRVREADIMPPSIRNPGCPPELDAVILAALQREPERRMPSAAAFREALDQIAARLRIQVSARSVADWMQRVIGDEGFVRGSMASAPSTRNRSPSSAPPMSSSQPRMSTPSRPPPLRRSDDDIRLAAEIWGEDAGVAATMGSLPPADFSRASMQPQPTHQSSPHAIHGTPSHHQSGPLPTHPQSGPLPTHPQSGPLPTHPPPSPSSSKAPWFVLAALAAVAVVLVTILVANKQSPAAPSSARFEIEPADATIEIAGKEVARASPYEHPLPAGVYTVTIKHAGFQPTTTQVSVGSGEHPVVRIALQPEQVVATAPPTIDLEPAIKTDPTPTTVTPIKRDKKPRDKTKPRVGSVDKPDDDGDDDVAVPVLPPPPVEEPKPPVIATKPPVKPVDPPKPVKPLDTRTAVVAASAVTKLTGELPAMRVSSSDTSVTAKLCIDEAGKVSSVKLIKAPAEVTDDLQRALSSWRYKPYARGAACFVVSLRLIAK